MNISPLLAVYVIEVGLEGFRVMQKILWYLSIVFLCAWHPASSAQDLNTVYLKCKPDPNEKLLGGFEMLLNKKTLEALFLPINQKRQFEETETEYVTRIRYDGKLALEIAINKYTLRYTDTNIAGVLLNDKLTHTGQCSILDKKL